jgi:Mg2+-importing ATPase
MESSRTSQSGLTTEQAQARLDEFGRNEPAPIKRTTPLVELFRLFLNPLVALLLIASVVSAAAPKQKNRIILALKARKHAVGFLGDGINDAPSLHAADAGISVSTAVDVAKDAAEVILLERSLKVLH